MKKLTIFIIIIILGIAGYEYYTRYQPQIERIAESVRSGTTVENIKAEIFTPGGLRAKIESSKAKLTAVGVIAQTNDQRALFGRKTLKENKLLDAVATAKVKDMFAGQYFEHISPLGKGPADLAGEAGYVYISIGENLALGNYANDAALVEAWMNSPGHKANILNSKFTEIGVAVLKGTFEGKTTWLAVQEFGRPASDCPPVSSFLKQQVDDGKLELDRLEAQVRQAKARLDAWPQAETREEISVYNQEVADYNAQVKVYNNRLDTQKQLVNQYNAQVQTFNACIAK